MDSFSRIITSKLYDRIKFVKLINTFLRDAKSGKYHLCFIDVISSISFIFSLLTYIIVGAKNWVEIERYKCKVEKRCKKKTKKNVLLDGRKRKQRTKKLKDIDNKLNEIKECTEKI